jgi:hypothetical protein
MATWDGLVPWVQLVSEFYMQTAFTEPEAGRRKVSVIASDRFFFE